MNRSKSLADKKGTPSAKSLAKKVTNAKQPLLKKINPAKKNVGSNSMGMMDFMHSHVNDLDEIIDKELKQQEAVERKEREKKLAERNKNMSTLCVPANQMSGPGSAGLSEIINEMEKKLDSAQRRFKPKSSKEADAEVNQFDIDFEQEVQVMEKEMIKRSSTGPVRRTSARNPKTPSTMERTGAMKSSICDEDNDDEAYTPECFKATSTLGQQTTDE